MGGPLTVFRRQAMACDFEISLNGEGENSVSESTNEWTGKSPAEVALDALDEVDRVESLLSIFRRDSAVSRLNLLAGEMNVPVDPELFDWLVLCRRLWEETHGAFDITSTPLWEAWGFARREGEIPTEEALAKARASTGMDAVRLDLDGHRIAFDRPGIKLGFGAIGKGIAVDRAAEAMKDARVFDFLVHGGRSSVYAAGGHVGESTPDTGRPCWTIGLTDPYMPDRRLGEFHLTDQALGTSGSQYQFFRYKGKRYPHIIDPRDGRCAQGLVEVCVVAPNATLADALSTAFFVLGPAACREYCQQHPEVGAVLLQEAPVPRRFLVVVYGLDSDCFNLL